MIIVSLRLSNDRETILRPLKRREFVHTNQWVPQTVRGFNCIVTIVCPRKECIVFSDDFKRTKSIPSVFKHRRGRYSDRQIKWAARRRPDNRWLYPKLVYLHGRRGARYGRVRVIDDSLQNIDVYATIVYVFVSTAVHTYSLLVFQLFTYSVLNRL